MSLITPDIGLIFWMTLIFAILFFLLAKFGFPIISGMVDKRSRRIEDAIAKAREAEERLSSIADEQSRMLEDARREQARILKEASDTRDNIIEEARSRAAEEAGKILSGAKSEIAAEREEAIREIRRYAASLSLGVAEKILRKELSSDEAQNAFVGRMMDEVERNTDKS
ncbi:MAG: F0F1 ATP synthase subunit B [Bacteroidales bacterium]|nr:F0F1 ATP synthase subunit B [Bacteroidales bacterium]